MQTRRARLLGDRFASVGDAVQPVVAAPGSSDVQGSTPGRPRGGTNARMFDVIDPGITRD